MGRRQGQSVTGFHGVPGPAFLVFGLMGHSRLRSGQFEVTALRADPRPGFVPQGVFPHCELNLVMGMIHGRPGSSSLNSWGWRPQPLGVCFLKGVLCSPAFWFRLGLPHQGVGHPPVELWLP